MDLILIRYVYVLNAKYYDIMIWSEWSKRIYCCEKYNIEHCILEWSSFDGSHQYIEMIYGQPSYDNFITLILWPYTVYPKKYAHGFVVLCFVVVMQSFIMNSHEVFIHIHQGCFAGTGAIVRLPQCQWSKPDGYGKISQCITTTKHSKTKTVCIFLGIYCITTSMLHVVKKQLRYVLQLIVPGNCSYFKCINFKHNKRLSIPVNLTLA